GCSAPRPPRRSAATRSPRPPRRSRCCCRWRCWWPPSWPWPGRSRRCGWRCDSIPWRRSVVDAATRMEARLWWASLWQRRGAAALAALAVAIGASVAAALMHVSGDVGAKLTRELRSLGPNLILAPAPASGRAYLDEADVRARLAAAGVEGVAV